MPCSVGPYQWWKLPSNGKTNAPFLYQNCCDNGGVREIFYENITAITMPHFVNTCKKKKYLNHQLSPVYVFATFGIY